MNYSERPASTQKRTPFQDTTQSLPSLPTSNPLGATSSQVAKGGECTDFSPVTFPANVDITLVRLLGENTWGWTTFKPSGFRVIYPAIAASRQNRQTVSRLLRTVFARRIFGHLCQARASLCATVVHTRRWLENSQRRKYFAKLEGIVHTLWFWLSIYHKYHFWQNSLVTKITDDKNIRLHQISGNFSHNFKQIDGFLSTFGLKKDDHFWTKFSVLFWQRRKFLVKIFLFFRRN